MAVTSGPNVRKLGKTFTKIPKLYQQQDAKKIFLWQSFVSVTAVAPTGQAFNITG
jgi:hypothetical protein